MAVSIKTHHLLTRTNIKSDTYTHDDHLNLVFTSCKFIVKPATYTTTCHTSPPTLLPLNTPSHNISFDHIINFIILFVRMSSDKQFPPQKQDGQPGKEHVMDPNPQYKSPNYKAADKLKVILFCCVFSVLYIL